MDKFIGRLLDGRYEILEEIGRGGMAVVYRSMDHRLNRYVAVKILKEELSRDEDFRRRFHAESQAVAMLSHANIVAVYDVNHSGEADYIVMELIDGLTLKQYMQQRGALSWREALHFATQIAKAIEHAHSRGIVHRDIKPHNIMILKDGSVKVADFGIARLNSSQSTLTREALGSVHYISPEQAKGSQVDARSDLYSLGVVMYEMLTGKPPYDGESPVAIAIQHINSTPTPPRQINPSIPLGLQQITLHAMCSDLSARYSSATAMIEDLEALRKNPQVVFRFNAGPGGATAYVDTRQTAQNAQQNPVRQPQRPASAPVQNGTQNGRVGQNPRPRTPAPADPRQKARTMAERSVQQSGGRAKRYEQEAYYDDDEDEEGHSSRVPIIIVSILLVAVLIAAVIFLRSMMGSGNDNETIEVPSFLGQRIEDVVGSELYPDFNLVEGDHVYSDAYEAGRICDQSIARGKHVVSGTTIRLSVSRGPQTGKMPDLSNYTQQEADFALSGLELNLSISYEFVESDSVEEGHVISTSPASGATLSYGDSVKVTIAQSPETVMVSVPYVIDLERDDAVSLLERYGLVAKVTEAENEADAGLVFYQSISSNTQVPEGTTVSIKVSVGMPSPSPSPCPSPSPRSSTRYSYAVSCLSTSKSFSHSLKLIPISSCPDRQGGITSSSPTRLTAAVIFGAISFSP